MEVNICIIKDVSCVITYVSEKYWDSQGGLYLKYPIRAIWEKAA